LRYGEAMVPTFIDRGASLVEGNRARQCIAGFLQCPKLRLREPGSYHAPGSFSFKAALKVQRKESNGVAGLAAAGSSLDRQKVAAILAISAI
jgi:hypothetical protein